MSDIYARIRARREELNLSQEELAKRMGYKSRSSINKIEMGENDIPQSKVEAFARALNTTPAYLMGWEDDSVPELNARDRRDIARYMAEMRERLASGEALMFDGGPLTPEAMDSILAAMQVGMEIAKKKNKEKYTPKKYRKE